MRRRHGESRHLKRVSSTFVKLLSLRARDEVVPHSEGIVHGVEAVPVAAEGEEAAEANVEVVYHSVDLPYT